MTDLHIDVTNPNFPLEKGVMVMGTIGITDPEGLIFHTLEVALVSRAEDGAATEYPAHTLRIAGRVKGRETTFVPFLIPFPVNDSAIQTTWEAVATLTLREGSPLMATTSLDVAPAPPPRPAAAEIAIPLRRRQDPWTSLGESIAACFYVVLGTLFLIAEPEVSTIALMGKAIAGTTILLTGATQWICLQRRQPPVLIKAVGSLLGLAYCVVAMLFLGLLTGDGAGTAPATWAIDPSQHLPWAISLPVLWVAVAAPWVEVPSDTPAMQSTFVVVALHGLCLLPLVAWRAPEFWRNELLSIAIALAALLLLMGYLKAWRYLSLSWVLALGLASVPSLIAMVVWDPTHGWRLALCLLMLLRFFTGLAMVHRYLMHSFGTVEAAIMPTNLVRCARMYLMITAHPPEPLTIVEVRAVLSYTVSSRTQGPSIPSHTIAMQLENPGQMTAGQVLPITFSTVLPPTHQPRRTMKLSPSPGRSMSSCAPKAVELGKQLCR